MVSPVRYGKIRSQLVGLVGSLGQAVRASDSLWWAATPRGPAAAGTEYPMKRRRSRGTGGPPPASSDGKGICLRIMHELIVGDGQEAPASEVCLPYRRRGD
ncbi:unnamed protein product [Pleuronectes platessa]|uniref:Uncharacterized protein n=1 Tax=Pleuronectes platessa TaxID=8262 RepID=A0A9N7UXY6_PLEPL|nr:unnamed protein product [Pleuronectes platessa]